MYLHFVSIRNKLFSRSQSKTVKALEYERTGKGVFSQSGPLMKLTHIMSSFFLTHIVSEAAKTFGKSQRDSVWFQFSNGSLAL